MPQTLRLILGDQLNHKHSWFAKTDDSILYVMMEMKQETGYVMHHVQKITAFFLAMREFAGWLEERGHQVLYLKLDDSKNKQSLPENLSGLIDVNEIQKFQYLLPDEYRLDKQLKSFCKDLKIESQAYDTEHFFTQREEMADFFKGKKSFLMETFYRHMRKKHEVLMDGGEPEGGKWNYDQLNRKKLTDPSLLQPPKRFRKNIQDVLDMLEKMEVKHFGEIDPENFAWAISRAEGLKVLNYFCEELLPNFGTFQDAMHTEHAFLFHSRLSFLMNSKLLSPKEVIDKVIEAYHQAKGKIEISQVEGFIRQILGWREFMRGVYWAKMPDYAKLNKLNHRRSLPKWYWSGDTKMNCLRHAISQSLTHAYAHHIQRLMITGNFALLANVHPNEVDEWYLGIYIDAIEWVEIPNTRGMSQFADGGIVGTKPYVSSANYIAKMSNYCKGCHYSKSKKVGEKACPFNSLYWNFYDRHRALFENNQRVNMMYRIWDKKPAEERTAILEQAEEYLKSLDQL
ncbi:cryptochrome/photolyase family protein [Litoribacter alkaliphilus]|uniref:Cryptochrome/photolyase family protein n=1 Tax=Litoribacter ruber TaxID=702568 RepID=A0AAP2CKJ3_9BACT|nr:cryptochrome/photolyase family protein [Litoribacter alkaliphilus]MBS9525474.1 cryptochrome/photolyase family protein [Litoribacter alkaliphilus]